MIVLFEKKFPKDTDLLEIVYSNMIAQWREYVGIKMTQIMEPCGMCTE